MRQTRDTPFKESQLYSGGTVVGSRQQALADDVQWIWVSRVTTGEVLGGIEATEEAEDVGD